MAPSISAVRTAAAPFTRKGKVRKVSVSVTEGRDGSTRSPASWCVFGHLPCGHDVALEGLGSLKALLRLACCSVTPSLCVPCTCSLSLQIILLLFWLLDLSIPSGPSEHLFCCSLCVPCAEMSPGLIPPLSRLPSRDLHLCLLQSCGGRRSGRAHVTCKGKCPAQSGQLLSPPVVPTSRWASLRSPGLLSLRCLTSPGICSV